MCSKLRMLFVNVLPPIYFGIIFLEFSKLQKDLTLKADTFTQTRLKAFSVKRRIKLNNIFSSSMF